MCDWLATLLCFGNKRSLPYDKISKTDAEDDAEKSFVDDNSARSTPVRTSISSDPVLINIRDLLQKRAQLDEEERVRVKKEAKIRREWMLAAAVINRLCFIFFTVVLIAVTLSVFVVFYLHH